jgi:hypothetical protein
VVGLGAVWLLAWHLCRLFAHQMTKAYAGAAGKNLALVAYIYTYTLCELCSSLMKLRPSLLSKNIYTL